MSKKIDTTNGKPAIVDDEDYLSLKSRNWYVKQNGNTKLICGTTLKKGKSRMVLLHREILGLSDAKKVVVHKNGNPFDNRKENLLVIDKGKQNYSRKKNENGKLYKGTFYNTKNRSYVAAISKEKIKYNLGSFATAEEAAMVYDKAAIELYGSLAKTNKALGLIKYEDLPDIKIKFTLYQKPQFRIERVDKVKMEMVRDALKRMCKLFNYAQLE
ncbi:hypothetical protein [Leptospira wolffii]|uniref:hypothetical protein n=1 Tax=Leptospira wolffii TaxID=409998 RepID=UPI001FEDC5CD|nr:hypothetical protein [Leptospira wolffii]